jgi:hypothetical protein
MTTKTAEQRARAKYTGYLRAVGRATRVDVGPARAYLRKLHIVYGMSAAMLAARCSLSEASIMEIIAGQRRGDSGRIHPVREIFRENEASVLAIEPEIPAERGGTRVNAIGTTRRVQALAAEGFPVSWVTEQIGATGRSFYLVAQGKRKIVYFSTAYKVKCLFEKLENHLDPAAHGIDPSKSKLTRTYAERGGYVRAAYWDWDTIDDPESIPQYTGYCGSTRGYRMHRASGIPQCPPCLAAVAADQQARRERRAALDRAPGSTVA